MCITLLCHLDIIITSSVVDVIDVLVAVVGVEVGLPVAGVTASPHQEGDNEGEDEKGSHDCTGDHHYLGHVHPAYQLVVLYLAQRHAFKLGWTETPGERERYKASSVKE